jgi:hypothetical protein
VLTENSLSEAVILLQRQELAPEARDIVEEAARLLAEGREGEARALIEKAEALAALHQPAAAAAEVAPQQLQTTAAPNLHAIVAPIAARLTEGFTGLLTGVLQEIHSYAGDQIRVAGQFLQQHINELDTAICDLVVVGERLQEQASEHQTRLDGAIQTQEELRGSVVALQESGREQTEALHGVIRVANELSSNLAEQVEASASRFVSVEERVGGLEQLAQEIPDRVSALAARLDGQNETLRLLQQRQANRVSTLNDVLDSLARLREPETPELAAMSAVA